MGEKQEFQPLTREDIITVALYRVGIVLATGILTCLAYLLAVPGAASAISLPAADLLGYRLYGSVGLSVFFIHLYIGRFKVILKKLYFISLGCLAALLYIGNGSLSAGLMHGSSGPLFLLPLSMCLGFVTAKEAFCFKLFEGYFLALFMPCYLLMVSGSFLGGRGATYGLVLIAVLLIVFTLRKTTMPMAYDIGDKSAYQ
jgi:uncharacterized integral membrane protein